MNSRLFRRVGGLVLGLLLAMPFSAGAGSAEREASETEFGTPSMSVLPDSEGARRVQTPEEALAHDAAIFAAEEGWSFEKAKRWLTYQEVSAKLISHLRRAYPDAFAATWLEDIGPGPRTIVRFLGEVPQAAHDMAKELGIEAAFSNDGTVSEQAFVRRASTIHDDLLRAGYDNIAIIPYPEHTRIDVYLTRPREARDKSEAELRASLPESSRASGVVVRFYDQPVATDEQARAGALMLTNQDPLCTSGFVVNHDDAGRGVTTAAHCGDDINVYEDPTTGQGHATQILGSHIGVLGDVEWGPTQHPGGHVARFYIDVDGESRNVRHVRSFWGFSPNDVFCFFGRGTEGADCAQVQAVY